MSAIDHGVPVSRKALYSRYNLPAPEDDEDVFKREEQTALPLGAFSFADMGDAKKKARKDDPDPVILDESRKVDADNQHGRGELSQD